MKESKDKNKGEQKIKKREYYQMQQKRLKKRAIRGLNINAVYNLSTYLGCNKPYVHGRCCRLVCVN